MLVALAGAVLVFEERADGTQKAPPKRGLLSNFGPVRAIISGMKKLIAKVRGFCTQKPPSYDGLCDVCEQPLPAEPVIDKATGGHFCSEEHYREEFADRSW